MEEFITVRSFDLPTDLAIVRLKVEEEGIEYQVADELTVQTNNFISNAVGGVKLQVRKSDYARANELFESLGYPEGKIKPSLVDKLLSDPAIQRRLKYVFIGFLAVIVLLVALVLAS
jgi:Ni,Fe-hydrogenase III large subunit